MFTNKAQLKRDIILIFLLLTVVLTVFVVTKLVKKDGDLAVVQYNNITLFEIEMSTGKYTAKTDAFDANELPVIDGEKLFVGDKEFINLTNGNGVLKYENYYFVKGNLGYVKIKYDPTTKKIKVVEETSPYNICSKQGYSNNAPIVCLPNFISIKFSKSKVDEII